MIKKILILFTLLSLSIYIYPQGVSVENVNRTGLRIIPVYQNWQGSDKTKIEQYSSRLLVNYYFDRSIRVSLQSGYASSNALDSKLNGVSDMQFSVNYKLIKFNTVFDAGINLPIGEERIDNEKFPSSILLSQEVFGMKIPLLGQGTNIFAGIIWAKEIIDNVAIGLGASYQIKGKYNPIAGENTIYKPSNELLLSGGLDFRINKTTNLSGDVIGIFYGKDKLNNTPAFSAGTRTIFSLIFRQYYGYNNLVVFLRFKRSAVDELINVENIISTEKINPNSFMSFINFRHYISRHLSLYYSTEGRFYQKTTAPFSGYKVYGIGISPNISLSSNIILPVTFKYYKGNSKGFPSIHGFESSIGLSIIF